MIYVLAACGIGLLVMTVLPVAVVVLLICPMSEAEIEDIAAEMGHVG